MSPPPIPGTVKTWIFVHRSGQIDLRRYYHSFRLTLGGRGTVDSYSSPIDRRPQIASDRLEMLGHANDGADGLPREVTWECPF